MLEKKKFDYSWVIIGVSAFIIFIVLGLCSSTKGIFLNPTITYNGLDRGPFAFSNTFRYITTSIVNIFFGALVMKLGIKKLVGFGFLSLVISQLLFALSSELWGFYLSGVFLGLGLAWTTTTMVGYIINKWVKKNRGTVMGFILATNGIGASIATNIYMPMINASATGYKTVCFIIAGLVAVAGVVAVIFIKDRKLDEGETMPTKKQKGDNWVGIDSKVAFKKVYFYLAMVCVFITGMVLQSVTGVFNDHMELVEIDPTTRQLVTTVYTFILTFTKFLTGFMYDRIGLKGTMAINYLCAVISMVMMALINPTPIGIAFCFVYAIAVDIALPLETIMLPIFAGDLFGRKDYAKMLGILVSVNTAGYAAGSPIMGFVFDAVGSYVPAFYVSAGLMLITIAIMFYVVSCANKEKRKIELEMARAEEQGAQSVAN